MSKERLSGTPLVWVGGKSRIMNTLKAHLPEADCLVEPFVGGASVFMSQQQYMSICIPMLMCADAIYLLDGWEESAGAWAEYAMALKLNMPVSYPSARAGGETVAQLLRRSEAAQPAD
ncbi:DUF4406 domain-containing protein [Escherichia coli]|uniref:DUF4406 domain-containing protein n=1 Tax=Escherichia coli TaxID=562 RepID=UPI000BDEAA27|nr:DUF4406 domain-containing protein [Escherichia coli]